MTVETKDCIVDSQPLDAEFGRPSPTNVHTPEAVAAFQIFAKSCGIHLDDELVAGATVNGKTVADFEPRGVVGGSAV